MVNLKTFRCFTFFLLALTLIMLIAGCGSSGSKNSINEEADNQSISEYIKATEVFLDNPLVLNAIIETGLPYYQMSYSRNLTGKYNARGEVTDSNMPGSIGKEIDTVISLENQIGNNVDFVEKDDDFNVIGKAGILAGEGNEFTLYNNIYSSSVSSCGINTVKGVIIVSGKIQNDGEVTFSALIVITEVVNCGTISTAGGYELTTGTLTPYTGDENDYNDEEDLITEIDPDQHENDNTIAGGDHITPWSTHRGTFHTSEDVDYKVLNVVYGTKYDIITKNVYSTNRTSIVVCNGAGKEYTTTIQPTESYEDVKVRFTPTATTTVYIKVSEKDGELGFYDLYIRPID